MPTPGELQDQANELLTHIYGQNRTFVSLLGPTRIGPLSTVSEKTKADIHTLLTATACEEQGDRVKIFPAEVETMLAFALEGKETQTMGTFILTRFTTFLHVQTPTIDVLYQSGELLKRLQKGPQMIDPLAKKGETSVRLLQKPAYKKFEQIRSLVTPSHEKLSDTLIEMCFVTDDQIHDNLEMVTYILGLARITIPDEIDVRLPHGLR